MDNLEKKKILILVEGEKTDVALMKTLFKIYTELNAKYQIVSYRTNIYALYQDFFADGESQDDYDLLQVLKAREPNPEKKKLFDEKYTDILLIFDLDPQDNQFSEQKIREMQQYFCESSDVGKLYLSYPMVEAFFHMPRIPDPDYKNRIVTVDELIQKRYKERVHKESRGSDYRKFITSRSDSNYVILENIRKALYLLNVQSEPSVAWYGVDLAAVLHQQLKRLHDNHLHVLCTCVMFIYDYNYELLVQQ